MLTALYSERRTSIFVHCQNLQLMTMRIFFNAILFSFFVIFSPNVHAQAKIKWNSLAGGSVTYEGNFDEGRSVIQAVDGSIIMAGSTNSTDKSIGLNSKGELDFLVTKTNAVGNLVWAKSYGGSGNDVCNQVINTKDGGLLLVGSTNSTSGDVVKNQGKTDVWMIKLSAIGDIQWQKTFGGGFEDEGKSIVQTIDGGYVVVGTTYSRNGDITLNKGISDVWVFKVDSIGNFLWQKTFGGNNLDEGNSIATLKDGSLIIGASTSSANGDVTNKKLGQDAWVIKLNFSGILQWQKTFGGNANEFVSSIKPSNDGSLFFVGATTSNDIDVSGNHGSQDLWLVKMDSTANLIWQKCFGGSLADVGNDLVLLADGSLAAVGYTSSNNGNVQGNSGLTDIWTIHVSSQGDLLFQNCLGGSGSEIGNAICATNDNNFLCFGRTNSNDGDVPRVTNGIDQWLIKIALTNTIVFQNVYGASTSKAKNFFNQVAFSPFDKGSVAVGFSNSIELAEYKGKNDFFVSKFDSLGVVKWSKSYGGSESDIATSVCMGKDSSYWIAGYTISDDGDISASIGSVDGWIINIDQDGLLLWEGTYGGLDDDFIQSIIPSNDGGYLLTGYSNSTEGNAIGNKGEADYWVIKISELGNVVWSKMYGGPDFDFASKGINTFDGGYLVTGNSSSETGDITENKGVQDIWVIKLSKTGSLEWQKNLGGTNIDGANALVQMPDSTFVIGGFTNSNDIDVTSSYGSQDIWAVRLKQNGDLIWQKNFGGTGSESATDMLLNTENEITLIGSTTSTDNDISIRRGGQDLSLFGIQNNGTLRWQKNYGGSSRQIGNSIVINSDGNYLVAGSTKSENGDVLGVNKDLYADDKAWLFELVNCPLPTMNTTGPIEICEGKSVVLKTGNVPGYNYQWYLNNSELVNQKRDSAVLNQTGKYFVKVTNSIGCTSVSDTVNVTVNANPTAPVISALGPLTFCSGGNVALKTAKVTGLEWDWMINGSSINGLTLDSTILAESSGNYTIIAQNVKSGCRSSGSLPITVKVNPIPAKPTVTLDGKILSSNYISGNQWYLNNSILTGVTTQKYTPTVSGLYAVRVTENNCQSLSSNEINFIVTSVSNLISGLNLKIYPNPVSGEGNLYINWNDNMYNLRDLKISIIDISGKNMMNTKASRSPFQLKMNVAPGIYFLKIVSMDGKLIANAKIAAY